jgi:hypothetical protein
VRQVTSLAVAGADDVGGLDRGRAGVVGAHHAERAHAGGDGERVRLVWTRSTRGDVAISLYDARPYDLRHSVASLLLHEGRSVTYVARQLGHAATLTLNTYGHVIDELDDSPPIPAEDAIRAARSGSCVTGVSQEEAHA